MALSFRPGDGESCCPVFGRRFSWIVSYTGSVVGWSLLKFFDYYKILAQ
jgi:hypothetical protein